jgi:NAD(P)-dependent dehydrogenase (short-subunit alcohol dehydrogenase family)
MNGQLGGRVAIVTGAGRGIGRGIALALAKSGAHVAVVDRVSDRTEAVTAELVALGVPALGVLCDVGDGRAVQRMVTTVVDQLGRLDVLVNNAQAFGAGYEANVPLTPLEELSEELWDSTFQTGVKATFYCCKAAFPHLRATSGRIINLVSYWGMIGAEGAGAYNANKEAIRGLTRTAAREWGQYGITVNAISPAAQTEAQAAWAEKNANEYRLRLQSLPMRRYGDPEGDIAPVAVFLASADSRFITGSTIMVDGGLFMSA